MNKSILIGCSILAAAIVVGALIYVSSNRYTTASGGDGRVYKVDKKTGETVLLSGSREIRVKPKTSDEPKTDADRAIELAKRGDTLEWPKNNETTIDGYLRSLQGDLNILGWSAEQKNEQTYIVWYQFENNGKKRSLAFEVNLAGGLVRNIKGDAALEAKYFGDSASQ